MQRGSRLPRVTPSSPARSSSVRDVPDQPVVLAEQPQRDGRVVGAQDLAVGERLRGRRRGSASRRLATTAPAAVEAVAAGVDACARRPRAGARRSAGRRSRRPGRRRAGPAPPPRRAERVGDAGAGADDDHAVRAVRCVARAGRWCSSPRYSAEHHDHRGAGVDARRRRARRRCGRPRRRRPRRRARGPAARAPSGPALSGSHGVEVPVPAAEEHREGDGRDQRQADQQGRAVPAPGSPPRRVDGSRGRGHGHRRHHQVVVEREDGHGLLAGGRPVAVAHRVEEAGAAVQPVGHRGVLRGQRVGDLVGGGPGGVGQPAPLDLAHAPGRGSPRPPPPRSGPGPRAASARARSSSAVTTSSVSTARCSPFGAGGEPGARAASQASTRASTSRTSMAASVDSGGAPRAASSAPVDLAHEPVEDRCRRSCWWYSGCSSRGAAASAPRRADGSSGGSGAGPA